MVRTIYYNGDIITMEPEAAQAVLVEDGVIRCVGGKEELLSLADVGTRLYDLKGQTLLPAFIDSHSHFMDYASGSLQVPLGGCKNFAEMIERIKAFIRENGIQPGAWVLCRDYDHNFLEEKQAPDRWILDQAAPENPVMIKHQSGHMGVCNSLGLKKLGLTADSPCPEGGRFGIEQGELTGYLEENAFLECQKKVPLASIDLLIQAILKTQEVYASHGITTLQEGMMVDEMAGLYECLVEEELLKLDVVGYADMTAKSRLMELFGGKPGQYHKHFRMGGYKIFLDGSPQGHTAWMLEPYRNDKEGYCGYPTLTDEQVTERVERALREGWQILAHCNGDAAARQYIRACQEAQRAVSLPEALRPVMIHAQLLRVEELDSVKACGIIPSFFVAHIWHWGDIHIDSFGLERASSISPAGSAQKKGICYTFHQDAPVIEPDMLETIWCGVNRITKNGVKLGPEECVTPKEALQAVTIHAAFQYGEEALKGSIRPGKYADLVILDRNPLKTAPMEIREIQVMETIKAGETVYKR